MPSAVGLIADAYNAPAGGGWTPASLTGLQLWLDAADTATITQSSGAVSQWNDKSGLGSHFVQSTGANQPITGTRTVNGLNVLDFNGTTHNVTRAAFTVAQPLTIAVVAQSDVVTAVATRIIGRGNSSTLHLGRGTAVPQMNGGTALNHASGWDTSGPHRVVGIFNGASSEHRFDAASVTGNAGVNGFTNVTTAQIGILSAAGWWDGMIAEIVVTNTIVAGADLTNLETYLKTKWGTP